jgi:ABC-type transport system substrate-binding protein
MKYRRLPLLSAGLALAVCLGACFKPKTESKVVIWELADPQMLQPIISTELGADMVMKYMFQSLTEVDFKTLELTPVLAESRAQIEKTPAGGMRITFRLRKEAKWDNGSPVTAKDVEFTLKATFNPLINNPPVKATMDFISDIQLYPNDPLKLTFLCDTVYFLAESGVGGFQIIPEYAYDSLGLMKGFDYKDLRKHGDKYKSDPKIIAFATDMNSEKRMRDKAAISGSGPYKLDEWVTQRQVVLKRKANYWADALGESVPYLAAYPDKIVFSTIKDFNSAVLALKAGDLDVLYTIKPKEFIELKENAKVKEKYNIFTPMMLSYYYIGINTKSPLLRDTKTRQALSCLADYDRIINTVFYGLAGRIVGPVHPSKKSYNADIPLYQFDPAKAKALLAEDGWKDTNGDGILDKVVDGQRREFKVTITVNSENELRKAIALLFQEEARKAGIEVTLVQQEWNTFISNMGKHKVELFISGWVLSPTDNDLKQIWHSESAVENGSNFANFCNPHCDSLLDAVRVEIDENKRAVMLKRLQVVLHEEAPYIFLMAPTERMAISKKFSNAEPSVMRPGFNASLFKLQTH